ncbi:GGDEF domain-containing protein [Thiosulfativibrio zosterae]|uniref:diguanylate cyclase n=1 Tax=Thiosulfativibrio zosterae TaxID=2675053 RepID=A0A6F8PLD3_9GAMM|nr:GGDEF domain-containing protein [Thiosulfativibrio zosterae]BBP42896.1 GGDEF domain-containing protein [Thiosulfativibrio zosterae]
MERSDAATLAERYAMSLKKSQQLAQDTLTQINQLGSNPTPLHFLLIFEWLSKIDPFAAEQIDTAIKLKQYNDATAEEMFHHLLSHIIHKNLPTEEFTNMINLLVENMRAWLQNSSQNNHEIEDHLVQLSDTLSKQGLVPGVITELNDIILPKLKLQHEETLALAQTVETTQNEVVRLKAELEKATNISITDELTNIPNRRGFKQLIANVINTAHESGNSFVMVVLDIDHFKKVNDTYGHLLGDSILRFLARFLKQETKGKDFIARVGGEEFVVVLTDTSYDNGMTIANNLRLKLANKPLKIRTEKQQLTITISAGVAIYQMGESYETLFNRADKALYLAKNRGRNKVCGETEI